MGAVEQAHLRAVLIDTIGNQRCCCKEKQYIWLARQPQEQTSAWQRCKPFRLTARESLGRSCKGLHNIEPVLSHPRNREASACRQTPIKQVTNGRRSLPSWSSNWSKASQKWSVEWLLWHSVANFPRNWVHVLTMSVLQRGCTLCHLIQYHWRNGGPWVWNSRRRKITWSFDRCFGEKTQEICLEEPKSLN